MKITEIEYGALVNKGNYENQKLSVRAKLEDWEDPTLSFQALRDYVLCQLQPHPLSLSEYQDLKYEAERELHKLHDQIKEAQEKWDELYTFLSAQGLKPKKRPSGKFTFSLPAFTDPDEISF